MAILDALLMLSDAQAFSADAYTTNTIDLLAANRDIGTGRPLALLISIDVAADFTSGDETYRFLLVQSANADLSSHDEISSMPFTAAQLVGGATFSLPVPAGYPTKRYLGGRFDGSGTTPTVTATVVLTDAAAIPARRIYHPTTY